MPGWWPLAAFALLVLFLGWRNRASGAGASGPTLGDPGEPVAERKRPILPEPVPPGRIVETPAGPRYRFAVILDGPSSQGRSSDRRNGTSGDMVDEDDDGYGDFVRRMWARGGVEVPSIALDKVGADGATRVVLEAVLEGERGAIYVNVVEGGVRKTYAGDGRHRWRRHGEPIDASAFRAILAGADPETALRQQKRPATAAEALDRANVHGAPRGRRWVIGYRNGAGEPSYRVISDVVRSGDEFSARCHFRWGERRAFRADRLTFVADAETGEEVPVERFMQPRAKTTGAKAKGEVGRRRKGEGDRA